MEMDVFSTFFEQYFAINNENNLDNQIPFKFSFPILNLTVCRLI